MPPFITEKYISHFRIAGSGRGAVKVGERPPPDGQAHPLPHLPRPRLGRPRERLRAPQRRRLRRRHEEVRGEVNLIMVHVHRRRGCMNSHPYQSMRNQATCHATIASFPLNPCF